MILMSSIAATTLASTLLFAGVACALISKEQRR